MNGDEDQPKVESVAINPDYTEYKRLQRVMNLIRANAQRSSIDSPEYQSAWKAREEIKNRYGGMPPSWVTEEMPA